MVIARAKKRGRFFDISFSAFAPSNKQGRMKTRFPGKRNEAEDTTISLDGMDAEDVVIDPADWGTQYY